jgi:hypothetical protein
MIPVETVPEMGARVNSRGDKFKHDIFDILQ